MLDPLTINCYDGVECMKIIHDFKRREKDNVMDFVRQLEKINEDNENRYFDEYDDCNFADRMKEFYYHCIEVMKKKHPETFYIVKREKVMKLIQEMKELSVSKGLMTQAEEAERIMSM